MRPLHARKVDPRRLRSQSNRLVRLADGEIVVVRPIFPTDIFGCYAMYKSLSAETRRYAEDFPYRLIILYMSAVSSALFLIVLLRKLLMILFPRAVTLAYVATNLKGKIIALSFLRLRGHYFEGYIATSGTFIAEDYQSRGLGTYLLNMKVEKGRLLGIRELLANVHSQNFKVVGLCRKIGFTPIKEIPPNRLLMRLTLHSEQKTGSSSDEPGLIGFPTDGAIFESK